MFAGALHSVVVWRPCGAPSGQRARKAIKIQTTLERLHTSQPVTRPKRGATAGLGLEATSPPGAC
eukprot:scaffold22486_cov62-Phaeocystis_antarctica.AAC.1